MYGRNIPVSCFIPRDIYVVQWCDKNCVVVSELCLWSYIFLHFFFSTAYIFIGEEVVAVDLAINILKDIELEWKSNTVLLQYNFGEVFGKKN